MVFSSLFFAYVFFPVCMLLYYASSSIKWRNGVLLAFSLLFYSWGEPVFVLLMIATVAVNYFLGLQIGKAGSQNHAKLYMALSVIVSLGSLGFFKYSGFFVETLNSLIGTSIPVPQVALPIGISFYTFQILTYVIDVYRGKVPAQKSFAKLLLYICCFHQLIAGPIVRYEDIANEIENRYATAEDITCGIKRFIIGFSKKVLLANMCGQAATEILNGDLSTTTVVCAWYGIIMYTLQIYFDFSAYSDMAIGMGRMCGVHYHENFNYPYMAKSVTEFWRRWHMSLSFFFRDYVYIPLGGNRKHQILNLFIVWFLTGMWHGASWNFIIWGLYYLMFLILEKFVFGKQLQKYPAIGHIYLLLVVIVGWVFFYYTDMSQAIQLLKIMFGISGNAVSDAFAAAKINNSIYVFQIAALCCIPASQMFKEFNEKVSARLEAGEAAGASPTLRVCGQAVQFIALASLFITSSIMLVGESYNPFLYFRF